MAGRRALSNMLILTATGMIAKTLDFSFRAYYSSRLGDTGMGIFSLIMSAFGIITNLTSAGMGIAVSRLAASALGKNDLGKAQKTVNTAVKMVLFSGIICFFAVLLFADRISLVFLKDIRCKRGLIYITPASIFMGISYCLKGYFYAQRRILIPASSEFAEQAVKISLTSMLLYKWLPQGTVYGVSAVLLGLTVGEGCSCLYLSLWYLRERRKTIMESRVFKELFSQTLPVTLSSVGCSYLRMQEDIWIIRGFKKFGMTADTALSEYGLIHGMAMPLLVFPLSLLSSFSALLVPEISRARETGKLKERVSLVYKAAFWSGAVIFLIFLIFGEEIALRIYGSTAAVKYIKPLCFLCPVMIMDFVATGMLGGLGQQAKLFKYSIADSVFRLSMVYLWLPAGGSGMLILMIFLSNILTFSLTLRRIKRLV